VAAHGGSVDVASEPGSTTFGVHLPAADAPADDASAGDTPAGDSVARELVRKS
jgi:hypothetical protein